MFEENLRLLSLQPVYFSFSLALCHEGLYEVRASYYRRFPENFAEKDQKTAEKYQSRNL